MGADSSDVETVDPETNGLFTEENAEEWRELHDKPFSELTDAEKTSKIRLSVRRRYDYPEWLLAFEYGAPGQNGSVCDCLALNTLPSRNYKVIGFEFKSSRSDWLREVRDGEKADYFVRLVDEFYVVAPKGVVEASEVPDGWGYLELKPNSERLYKMQDSELTTHQQGEPDRRFWIRFLKQAVGGESNYSRQDLREARSRGYDDAKDDGITERELDRDIKELRRKAESYDRLREKFGFLSFREFSEEDAEVLEEAIWLLKAVQSDNYGSLQNDIEHLQKSVDRRTEEMLKETQRMEAVLEDLREHLDETTLPGLQEPEEGAQHE